MAVADSAVFEGGKDLFLAAEVLADTNARLAAIGSPLTFRAGTRTLEGRAPGLLGRRTELCEAVPERSRFFGGLQGSGAGLTTLEACSAHGFDVMGVGHAQAPNNAWIDLGNGERMDTVTGKLDNDAKNEIIKRIVRREQRLDPNAELDREEAQAVYNQLPESKRRRYAQQFGINQFARPEVGEGIEAIRAQSDTKKQANRDRGATSATGFPMHFAPVVARSGDDYVTMESVATSSDRAVAIASTTWFYRMYGRARYRDDQSYYGQHAAEASIGDRDEILGLTNRPLPKGT